jgi:hypothetical protein
LCRLRKKAGRQRRRSITNFSRGDIARSILHGVTNQYETESSSRSGLQSVVDRSSAERKNSMISARTDIENRQRGKLEVVPKRGEYTSIGTCLSYQYLPAVLKTLLEMTIRHTGLTRTTTEA